MYLSSLTTGWAGGTIRVRVHVSLQRQQQARLTSTAIKNRCTFKLIHYGFINVHVPPLLDAVPSTSTSPQKPLFAQSTSIYAPPQHGTRPRFTSDNAMYSSTGGSNDGVGFAYPRSYAKMMDRNARTRWRRKDRSTAARKAKVRMKLIS